MTRRESSGEKTLAGVDRKAACSYDRKLERDTTENEKREVRTPFKRGERRTPLLN